ncbi:unnamed protein product [Cochlearia groenlandica]
MNNDLACISSFSEPNSANRQQNPLVGIVVERQGQALALGMPLATFGHLIPLVIIETGWPSSGYDDASTINNHMFLTGLSSRLERPMLGGIVSHVFLHELFDSARKVGEWSILYHNMTPKLELDFSPKKHVQSHFNGSLLLKILISILALTGISGF